MGVENNNSQKGRFSFCGCCDGTFELIRDCFPDDAGYSDCLSRMQGMQDNCYSRKSGDTAKEEKRD